MAAEILKASNEAKGIMIDRTVSILRKHNYKVNVYEMSKVDPRKYYIDDIMCSWHDEPDITLVIKGVHALAYSANNSSGTA